MCIEQYHGISYSCIFRCLNWSICDLAGESCQLALVELISNLAELLTPIDHTEENSQFFEHKEVRNMLKHSLEWAKTAFADIVNILLNELREEIPSVNARLQLLSLLTQYLGSIFGQTSYVTVEKAIEVLALIRSDLLLLYC
jgi:hypothetical protein